MTEEQYFGRRTQMKATLSRILLISAAIATLVFLWAWRSYPAGDLSAHLAAVDVGVLAFSAALFLQSLFGLAYNNFLFSQQEKDWRDFWSGDVLEYFYQSSDHRELWMLARGRYILYFLCCLLSPGVFVLYTTLRH